MRVRTIALALTTAACSSSPPEKRERGSDASEVDDSRAKAEAKPDARRDAKADAKRDGAIDPCSPLVLGLGEARPVAPWAAPAECAAKSGPPGPATIRSEAEFRGRFSCPSGIASGIDFTKQELVVADRELSPASAGISIVDDGLRVTFIARFRSACPDDPRPMPIPYTLAFLQPKGAARSYGDASCTLPKSCG